MPLIEIVVAQHKLSAFPSPVVGIEEDVETTLRALADPNRLCQAGVLHHPLSQLLVPSPIPCIEFACRNFLKHIACVLVKDGEEGVVGECRDARMDGRYVVHRVCSWKGEVWDYVLGCRICKWCAPHGVERFGAALCH